MQAEDSNQIGPLDKYLRPKARRTLPCVPQTAFRYGVLAECAVVHAPAFIKHVKLVGCAVA
jgi:hypothetical protein